jgi:hypothetical protein
VLAHARTLQGLRALVLDDSILVVRYPGRFMISDAFLVFSAIEVQFGQVTARADCWPKSAQATFNWIPMRACTLLRDIARIVLHCSAFAPRLCGS